MGIGKLFGQFSTAEALSARQFPQVSTVSDRDGISAVSWSGSAMAANASLWDISEITLRDVCANPLHQS